MKRITCVFGLFRRMGGWKVGKRFIVVYGRMERRGVWRELRSWVFISCNLFVATGLGVVDGYESITVVGKRT